MAAERVKIGVLSSKVSRDALRPGYHDEKRRDEQCNEAQVDTLDKMINEIGSITIEGGKRDAIDKRLFEKSEITDDMLCEEGPTAEMDDFAFFGKLSLFKLPKLTLIVFPMVVKRYTRDVAGVKACIADNGLSPMNSKDVVYAMIIINLVHYRAIHFSDWKDPIYSGGIDCPLLDLSGIHAWEKAARQIVILTIHRVAKDTDEVKAKCYKYFCKNYGDIISEKRFDDLCKMINRSKGLIVVAKALTIGEIRAEDEGLQHCLKWASTPELIMKAFKAASSPLILGYVNATALEDYARFYMAGIAAQVAAGPLKAFCKGKVDPLKVFPIPDHIRVCDLAPIHKPPYDSQTISQAKIIMDAYGIEYGMWYQGKKASEEFPDYAFGMVVSQTRSMEKEAAAKKYMAGSSRRY